VAISFKTLKEYLSAMEKSYLLRLVSPFFTNPNKEIIKQPKVYFIDNGMRNLISGNVGMNMDGPSFENLVFSELIKMGYEPKYWQKKTGTEVDFIIRSGSEDIPIEVKLKVPDMRIEHSMRSYMELYAPKRAFVVVSEGARGEMEAGETQVKFLDLVGLREEMRR
ncbi:MAG: DUF4143 domain-containing protein, partial [Candidatus Thermoplasmatota archaeon]|nr:DUF4143 domain-containing protein [Candidatus Thermoplasmatota archaeon]